MNKARLLLWGNVLLFVFFIFQVITSGILFFVVMSKQQEHAVYLVHAYSGFLMLLLVIVHLALHWRMIRHVYFD
ncbi:MAG: DUF4405 domain-containing protein [Candidatus Omnitrophica bacterium]|nr:DUF4405 domain-containing protein [Candidatus Omnitrophota bacterium]